MQGFSAAPQRLVVVYGAVSSCPLLTCCFFAFSLPNARLFFTSSPNLQCDASEKI